MFHRDVILIGYCLSPIFVYVESEIIQQIKKIYDLTRARVVAGRMWLLSLRSSTTLSEYEWPIPICWSPFRNPAIKISRVVLPFEVIIRGVFDIPRVIVFWNMIRPMDISRTIAAWACLDCCVCSSGAWVRVGVERAGAAYCSSSKLLQVLKVMPGNMMNLKTCYWNMLVFWRMRLISPTPTTWVRPAEVGMRARYVWLADYELIVAFLFKIAEHPR